MSCINEDFIFRMGVEIYIFCRTYSSNKFLIALRKLDKNVIHEMPRDEMKLITVYNKSKYCQYKFRKSNTYCS